MLSEKQVELLQETWSLISQDLEKASIAIFQRLFSKYPDYQQSFPFKDVPQDELINNAEFLRHVLNVGRKLDSTIKGLPHNVSKIKEEFTRVGLSHKKRNVTAIQFRNASDTIVEVITESLGDKCTEPVEEAWKITLGLITDFLIEGSK